MTNIARLPVAPVDINPDPDDGDLPAGWSWRQEPARNGARFAIYRIDYGDETVARIVVRRASRDRLGLPGPAVFGPEIAEGVARLIADIAGGEA